MRHLAKVACQLASTLALAALLAPSARAQSLNWIDDYSIKDQIPMFGAPGLGEWTDEDALGVSSGCGTTGGGASSARTSLNHGMSDRVLLHSGQEVRTEVDLFVPGRDHAVDLVIQRRHTTRRLEYGTNLFDVEDADYGAPGLQALSGADPDSPFGPGWAFNYDHSFSSGNASAGLVLEMRNFGRTDSFIWVDEPGSQKPDDTTGIKKAYYRATGDRIDRGLYLPHLGQFIVSRPGGSRLIFAVNIDGSGSDFVLEGRLTNVISPNGNSIEVRYDDSDPSEDFLQQDIIEVVDSWGRSYDLEYADKDLTSGAHPWVTAITYDGLRITYGYAEAALTAPGRGSLTSVTTPPVTGVAHNSAIYGEFLSGKTTSYDYVYSLTEQRANFCIQSIKAPNEGSAGDSVLSWTYCDVATNPGCVGWVASHTVGSTTSGGAGGTYEYSYVLVSPLPSVPSGVNEALVIVTVTNRSGAVTNLLGTTSTLEFNRQGQLRKEIVDVQGGAWTTTYFYTDEGLLETTTLPSGSIKAIDYEDPTMSGLPLGSIANADLVVHTPDGGRQPAEGAISTVTYKVVREPLYNKPFKVIDPRGYGTDEAAYTTTFIYDYMEDLTPHVAAIADRLGLNDTDNGTTSPVDDVVAWYAANGISAVTRDINKDGRTDQSCGQLIRIEYPDATIVNAATTVTTVDESAQEAFELLAYNDFGQRLYHQDAEGNVHAWTYYGEGDVDGNGATPNEAPTLPDLPDLGGGGFLKSEYRGVTTFGSLSTLYSALAAGTAPSTYLSSSDLAYTGVSLHGVPPNPRGHASIVTDGRGVTQYRHINELDQLVSVIDAAAVPTGLNAFEYRTVYAYDGNDNLVTLIQPDEDGLAGTIGVVEHSYEYDLLNNLKATVSDVGGVATRVEHDYDASENQTKTREEHDGVVVRSEEWQYDKRHLLKKHIRGTHSSTLGSTVEVTLRDDNGNPVTIEDDDDDVTTFFHDGYDRLYSVEHRDGTITHSILDEAGNRIREEVTGKYGNFPVLSATLSVTHYAFDERNRLRLTAEEEFWFGGGYQPDTVAGISAPQGGGLQGPASVLDVIAKYRIQEVVTGAEFLWSAYEYDKAGRLVATLDADGDASYFEYDELSRLVKSIDAVGNELDREYDANGNVESEVRHEKPTALVGTWTSGYEELFKTSYSYDALNRMVVLGEHESPGAAATQLTSFSYDSRDSLIRTTDALGNVQEQDYDKLDRPTESTQWLSASGEDADPQFGSTNGSITILSEWDDLNRLIERTDDRGNETGYDYDDLGRLEAINYDDSKSETFLYNGDDELTTKMTRQGVSIAYARDPMGRAVTMTADTSGINAGTEFFLGSTFKRFDWDGLGRLWGQCDHNLVGTNVEDIIVFYKLDSLGRTLTESQWIQGISSVIAANPSLGSPLATSEIRYDGYNRVSTVGYPGPQSGPRVLSYTHDGLDRTAAINDGGVDPIVSNSFIGGRQLQRSYRNGTILDKQNDALDSTISGAGRGYDGLGRSREHAWTVATGGATVTGYENSYNAVNLRVGEVREHLGHEDRYTFDAAYRMIEFVRNDETATSGIDEGIASTRILDGADKMSEYTEGSSDYYTVPAGPAVPYFPATDGDRDASGNLSTPSPAGINQYSNFGPTSWVGDPRDYTEMGGLKEDEGSLGYTYDAWGRLTSVWQGPFTGGAFFTGILLELYIYDALDRRLLVEVSGGVPTQYLYAGGWQVIEERNPLATLVPGVEATQRQFVTGDGIDDHLQMLDYSPTSGGPVEYYYHCSSQGFVGALTDGSGIVVEYYEYSMLGQPTVLKPNMGGSGVTVQGAVSTIGNPYSFQGRRYEPLTGFFHFRNRFYDPRNGEFVSLDPTGMWAHGQGNGYDAFRGDCWNMVDPLGENPVAAALAAALASPAGLAAAGGAAALTILTYVYVTDRVPIIEELDWFRPDLTPRPYPRAPKVGQGPVTGSAPAPVPYGPPAPVAPPPFVPPNLPRTIGPMSDPFGALVAAAASGLSLVSVWETERGAVCGATALGGVYEILAKGLPFADRAARDVLPGRFHREYPEEHMGKSLNEIKKELRSAKGALKDSLQKAKKLLQDTGRLVEKLGGKSKGKSQ